jgi:uncharacterized protein
VVDQRIIDTVRQFVMIIPKDLGVKKAYLFGSYARGKEREGSDIDIALVLENMPDFFSTQRQLMKPPCTAYTNTYEYNWGFHPTT